MTDRLFPVMDGPSVPWAAMAPHEYQAQINHGQSLEALARRGGMSSFEAWCVVHGINARTSDPQDKRPEWRVWAEQQCSAVKELAALRRFEAEVRAVSAANRLAGTARDYVEGVEDPDGYVAIHGQDRRNMPVLTTLLTAFSSAGFELVREFRYGKSAGQSVVIFQR